MAVIIWFFVVVVGYLASAFIGAYLIDYVISFWLIFFDKPDTFTWMHGFYLALIPFVSTTIALQLAIVTFILSFFLI